LKSKRSDEEEINKERKYKRRTVLVKDEKKVMCNKMKQARGQVKVIKALDEY